MTLHRLVVASSVTLLAGLLLAGCAAGPGGENVDDTSVPTASPGAPDGEMDDLEGVLLDDGRMFGVVSWGSSSCVPQVGDVSADGQTVTVALVDPDPEGAEEQMCTADYAPRASIGALPDGIDPTKEITLQVTYGDIADDVDLDGIPGATGTPGSATEYQPSAGWFDDGGLVLLTWGSSTCPPVVESVEGSGAAGTVVFTTDETRPCTKDMVPRGTIIAFTEDEVDDDAFTLTLSGGGLDGTVEVR